MSKRRIGGCLWSLVVACVLTAPAQTISTIAGSAIYDRLPATQTPLNLPAGIAADPQGNFWIADTANHVIRRVEAATGLSTVVAGGGTVADPVQPIAATSAILEKPTFVVRDSAGNLYFCETARHRVRKISPDGILTTVAGTGQQGFSGDNGLATRAQLSFPEGLAVDSLGNLYISDSGIRRGGGRVRKVTIGTGIITTVAGGGPVPAGGTGGDGLPATSVAFSGGPFGLAFDSRGNLHIVAFNVVKRVDAATGIITTIAGNGTVGPSCCPDNVPPTSVPLGPSYGLAFDAADNLYIGGPGPLYMVDRTTGLLSTPFRGLGGLRGQGTPTSGPSAIALEPSGKILLADRILSLVLRIDPLTGSAAVVAGTADPLDGPLALASVTWTLGLAGDPPRGLLYFCDSTRQSIRKVDLVAGQISTVIAEWRNNCSSLAVDAQGAVYFVEGSARLRIQKINPATGVVSAVAGSGQGGFSGDGGPALEARFGGISAFALDAAGNLYIHDNANSRIRRVDAATGIIQTVAGNGSPSPSAEEGPALSVGVGGITAMAFDRGGNLLLGDFSGNLRRYNPSTGLVSAILRGGDYSGDGGPAANARAYGVYGIAVDSAGNIFFADLFTHVVRRIDAGTGIITTLAGTGQRGFSGDGGLARLARLDMPNRVAVDAEGNVYVAEFLGGKLRKVTVAPPTPVLALSETELTFTAIEGGATPEPQSFRIESVNLAPMSWSAQVATTSGGGWLRANPTSGQGAATVSVLVDHRNLNAGIYQGVVRVAASGLSGLPASGSPKTIGVTLNVGPPGNPALGLSTEFLKFEALQGGPSPASQTIAISNLGSGTLQWTATVRTSGGGDWLRLSTASGIAPTNLVVTANSGGLAAGAYTGLVTIRDASGGIKTVAVTLVVSRAVPILQPSQTGFLFQGIEGVSNIPPQSFQVLNVGQGTMSWQVTATTADGRNWLSVTPSSGASEAGAGIRSPAVTVRVDAAQLRAGVSVGLLSFEAPGAPNSPQVGIVLVNVLPPGSDPLGLVQPAGLIFIGMVGGASPVPQELTLTSTGGKLLQFVASPRTASGGNWLTVTPSAGSLSGSGDAAPLQVQVNTRGLVAGIYIGTITVALNTGKSQDVAVALVVTPAAVGAGVATGSEALHLQSANACTPSKLTLVETLLAGNFAVAVGWPAALRVQVVDDCGQPVAAANVVASFTNGDPALVLANLKDGRYAGTWVPARETRTVAVTIRALAPGLPEATVRLEGAVSPAGGPLAFRNGTVNAASYARFAPLAPGTIFSLFGRNLANTPGSASGFPLPRELGEVRVTLGGLPVPLLYADSGQINGQIPFELTPGTTASLVVSVRGVAAPPDEVTVAAVQPGIFTMDQSGTGQGAILNTSFELVDAARPAAAGEIVQVFCTGLGATAPAVPSGAAAPSDPLARVTNPVTATIGGINAPVQFAGLAPGFVGLYQVNVQVPPGVAPGPAVPLVLSQGGVSSNTVTLALR